jgi:short-subunit dehydrogenase
MSQRFSNKVVLVTGASIPTGIGAAVARRFAAEGAALALAARSGDGLEAVASKIRAGGSQVRTFPTDVTDLAACEALVARTVEAFGGIDVLVNNAAANTRGPIASKAPRDLANVIEVNLVAPIVLTRLVLPHLRARGGGSIVQIASIAGQMPLTDEATYSASKFGLRAFSFAVREELAGTNIRVSVISPGPVETDFLLGDLDEVPDIVLANPMSTPDDVAKLVLESTIDGRRERTIPVRTGILAQVGNAFPGLARALVPVLERRGKAAKAALRARGHS